jgi:hypothetical protein
MRLHEANYGLSRPFVNLNVLKILEVPKVFRLIFIGSATSLDTHSFREQRFPQNPIAHSEMEGLLYYSYKGGQ